MKPWPSPRFTDDRDILLHSDSLLTVCEPSADVRSKYLKKIGLKEEDLLPKEEEKVLLNENEQLPDVPNDDWIDEYDPIYSQD